MRRIIILAALMLAAPAHALSTFASFDNANASRSFNFVSDPSAANGGSFYTTDSSGVGSAIDPGKTATRFSFLGNDALRDLSSSFIFTASSADAAGLIPGTALFQSGISGFFEFRYTGANDLNFNNVTYSTGALLLRGDFTNAILVGMPGGSSAGLSDSTLGDLDGTINYLSDFGSFSAVSEDFSISLVNATPRLNVTNEQLRGFGAVPTGSFSSDFSPTVSAAPEPMTWMMFVLGFGLSGSILRRDGRVRKLQPRFA